MAKVYPSYRYHPKHPETVVNSEAEDAALGAGWVDSPAKFAKSKAPAAAPEEPKHEGKEPEVVPSDAPKGSNPEIPSDPAAPAVAQNAAPAQARRGRKPGSSKKKTAKAKDANKAPEGDAESAETGIEADEKQDESAAAGGEQA